MKEIITVLILILLVGAVLGFAIWYGFFQFNLCYPEVSDNFWYCLQHAS